MNNLLTVETFPLPFYFTDHVFSGRQKDFQASPSGGETSLRTAGLDLTEELECDLWLTSGLSCLLTTTVKCWLEDALMVTWISEEVKLVEQEPDPDLDLMKEAEVWELTVSQKKTHTGMEGTLRRCLSCFIHPKNLSHFSIKTSNKMMIFLVKKVLFCSGNV